MKWSADEMDRMFNPRVVAVVGDKADRNYNWLRNVLTLNGKSSPSRSTSGRCRALMPWGLFVRP